jgi:hypothetical protein
MSEMNDLEYTCELNKKPSDELLFPKTKNDWDVSKHPWCIACEKQYHDVCLVLASLLSVEPRERRVPPKTYNIEKLIIEFEKMRIIFFTMMLKNPLNDDHKYDKDNYMEFYTTIFKLIENILIQLFLCINERIKHHLMCVIHPDNENENNSFKFGYFGNPSHRNVIGIYSIEFICFYVLYTSWLEIVNIKRKVYYLGGNTSSEEVPYILEDIFLTKYNDGMKLIYNVLCYRYYEKNDFEKYFKERIEIIKKKYRVVNDEEFLENINKYFYTSDCEKFPIEDRYVNCRKIILDRIKNFDNIISNKTLYQFEKYIYYFNELIVPRCEDFVKNDSLNLTILNDKNSKYIIPHNKDEIKNLNYDSHSKSRENKKKSRTYSKYISYYTNISLNTKKTQFRKSK